MILALGLMKKAVGTAINFINDRPSVLIMVMWLLEYTILFSKIMDKNRIITGGAIPNYPGRGSQHLPGKILVIEDDLGILKMVRLLFEGEGYEVLTQMNSLEIMKVCLDDRPDVIVLDVILPYRDVVDVFIELRSDPRTEQIPIVLVFVPKEGERTDHDKVETLKLGSKDAIVELSDVAALVKNVEQALPPNRRNLRGTVLWQADD